MEGEVLSETRGSWRLEGAKVIYHFTYRESVRGVSIFNAQGMETWEPNQSGYAQALARARAAIGSSSADVG